MRSRLILPTTLAVSVTLAAACSTPAGQASVDVPPVTDRGATDASPLDAIADAVGDAVVADVAADAARDATVDRGDACVMTPLSDKVGLACRRRAGAPSSTVCPDRACTADDCPAAGCQSCGETLFCIPEDSADITAVCDMTTCDPAACPTGCRAVG